MDEDYVEQTDVVAHALNGIGSVFELQVRTLPSVRIQPQLRMHHVGPEAKERLLPDVHSRGLA